MDVLIMFFVTYTAFYSAKCAYAVHLEIYSSSKGIRVDETLNLICELMDNPVDDYYNMSWQLPKNIQNSRPRLKQLYHQNKIILTLENLQERDSGNYSCEASNDATSKHLSHVWVLNVKPRKSCPPDVQFMCLNKNCIHKRYLCDGHDDCSSGEDEAVEICGPSACEGKVRCQDRCIPKEWCCDDLYDPNCTVKIRPDCCASSFSDYHDSSQYHDDDDYLSYLQTTIYTIVGCATAFMFIVTILVIAICRVNLKRAILTQCPEVCSPAATGRHMPQHLPLYDVDVFFNRSSLSSEMLPPQQSFLVTYNINNGVQFVGRPVEPPPYCEIVASPPKEGPPPPYVSQENLCFRNSNTNSNKEDQDSENPLETDSLLSISRQYSDSQSRNPHQIPLVQEGVQLNQQNISTVSRENFAEINDYHGVELINSPAIQNVNTNDICNNRIPNTETDYSSNSSLFHINNDNVAPEISNNETIIQGNRVPDTNSIRF